jgi:phosphate transport system permease protein
MTDVLEATESRTRPPRTSIPLKSAEAPVAPRRRIRGTTFDGRFNLLGAAAGSTALTTLLFGWFTPLTGGVGWVVVAFLLFLVFYVVLTALTSDRQEVFDRIATVLLISAGVVLFGALVFVVIYTLVRGSQALPHLNLFTQTMEFTGPLDPLTQGGILHAIVGSLIQISIALAITVPLGLTTAVFLNEVGGRFARFVRTVVDAMTALPSMAITVMMMPIVVRASDVVLRLVPGNLREASYALGATKWRTVWHVVLPTARSGLVTAVILGTARGIGETSPVLLTSGITAVLNVNPFSGPMISLPLQVFDFVKSPEPAMVARGFGTAATLLLLVLLLFTIARTIGGRGPGQLSSRAQRRLGEASRRDAIRFHRRRSSGIVPDASTPPSAAPPAAVSPEKDAP